MSPVAPSHLRTRCINRRGEDLVCMAATNVHVRTLHGSSAAAGWSGPRTVAIDRSESAGGLGIGFNGGELLLLAIGACYTNDLYREAAKRNMTLSSVAVDVQADWGGEPVRAQNVRFDVRVTSKENKEDVIALIGHTNEVAEIHNSLRKGTSVTMGKIEATTG